MTQRAVGLSGPEMEDRPVTSYSVWLRYLVGDWQEEWAGYESIPDALEGLGLAFEQAKYQKADVIGGCLMVEGVRPDRMEDSHDR